VLIGLQQGIGRHDGGVVTQMMTWYPGLARSCTEKGRNVKHTFHGC
jgi:hypothetical protein